MAITYEKIYSTTLSSTATDVTFSSIPATYTDLIIVCNFKIVTGASYVLSHQVNGDTATNYSSTYFVGTGSAVAAGNQTNSTYMDCGYLASNGGNFSTSTTHFFSYANTNHNKTMLTLTSNYNGGQVTAYTNLWRSSSAINSIKTFSADGRTYAIGSTFTLYGILAA
jgi:hypothetical protein